MTEPRANAVRCLLINGGIHLTSSCYSWAAFCLPSSPPSRLLPPPPCYSLSHGWLQALTLYAHRRDRAARLCLPTSATETICNAANRAQRLRESTRSRGAPYKLVSVSSLAGTTYPPRSLIFRLGLFNVARSFSAPFSLIDRSTPGRKIGGLEHSVRKLCRRRRLPAGLPEGEAQLRLSLSLV